MDGRLWRMCAPNTPPIARRPIYAGPALASAVPRRTFDLIPLATSVADLPLDSQPASGVPALTAHNLYPQQWQRSNALAAQGRDRPVWFARSSSLTSPGTVPLFWLGDQLPTWDRLDGLASVVLGLLSSGLSGHALTHSDTGGYTTIAIPPLARYVRSRELLQRWTELNIFTAFLRTHEGSAPTENAQVYDDDDSLSHFAWCSSLFASLAPYRDELMKEASQHGWPLVRPAWLHHEDDATTLDLEQQFLLGSDVMVAPVLHPGATRVRLYLPRATW